VSLYDQELMHIIAELDDETFVHCKRVQTLALALGEKMGLTSMELKHLGLGAFLHDIGKKFIPQSILLKEGPLTSDEWELMRMHPQLGSNCAKQLGFGEEITRIILEHHLWANGRGGYPLDDHTLRQPSLLAQITTVADVVDAMTSHRPYRPALSLSVCLDYLEEHSGTQFNKDIVKVFQSSVPRELASSG